MAWRKWWDRRYDNPWERAAKIRIEADHKASEIERRARLTPEERSKERAMFWGRIVFLVLFGGGVPLIVGVIIVGLKWGFKHLF
jgi:hypothetical protein